MTVMVWIPVVSFDMKPLSLKLHLSARPEFYTEYFDHAAFVTTIDGRVPPRSANASCRHENTGNG
jgi:hypothetical protein